MTEIDRRQLLKLCGIAGIAAIAGCADDDDETDDDETVGTDDEESEPTDDEEMEDDEEMDDQEEEEAVGVEDQPEDAAAMFVTPQDGDTVESPVQMEFEVEGVELAPAGEPVVGEGHLHVMVDRDCFEEGESIPGPSETAEEDGIFHFGDGQSEGELDLEPGEYDLCLQLADGPHRAFGETDEITITVEE